MAFTAQLAVSGNTGTVTYTQSTDAAELKVSSSGAVTATGTLAIGSYTAAGTTSDPYGDTGTFSYTLTVTAGTITQLSPTSADVTIKGSYPYSNQLNVAGNNGPVTYTQTYGAYVKVSSSGAVSTTQLLPAAPYTARGTARDPDGDTGTFTFVLAVSNDAHHPGRTHVGQHDGGQLGRLQRPTGSHGQPRKSYVHPGQRQYRPDRLKQRSCHDDRHLGRGLLHGHRQHDRP